MAEEIQLDTRASAPAQDFQKDFSRQPSITEIPREYPKGIRMVFLTLSLILSLLLAALDGSILATAIPAITTEFGSIANIAWYGTAYSITNGAFKLVWGKAYQSFRIKRVFFLAVLLFETGNIVCGAAKSGDILILGRVVAGLGGGGIMTGTFIIISLSVHDQYRAAYMGIVSITFGIASVAGPLLGGGLTDTVGWRWCFWINVPLGVIATAIMGLSLKSPITIREKTLRQRIQGLDLGGGVLVTSFLSCFVLGMHYSGTHSWSALSVVGSLVGSALSLLAFIFNEWKMGEKAMVHAGLLRKPDILKNLVFAFFLAGVFYPLQYTLPVQFQSVDAASASQSGVRQIPMILGISVFTSVANGALTWWRHYRPFMLLGAILATAGTISIYSINAPTSTRKWIPLELLTGMGIGITLQIPLMYNQSLVTHDDIPSVTALTLFTENLGTSLLVASAEAAFTQGVVSHLKKVLPDLDPQVVINTGAVQLRDIFQGRELDKVLGSYLHGCRTSHLIGVSCGIITFLISAGGSGSVIARVVKDKFWKSHAS